MKPEIVLRRIGVPVLLIGVSLALSAASSVVAEGANGQRITTDDIHADALRLPVTQRSIALAAPDAVQQAAQNLYVRRMLAEQAVRDGLDKDPLVSATLQLVRDRVLSEARLTKIDEANKPAPEAVEAVARASYRANPERFRTADQTRARHILVTGHTEQAKREAEALLAELKGGADFEKVAREKSHDTSSERGGDLGWFDMGRMVPEFDAALDELKKPGDMSGLVRTQFGWHIIKLEGRRAGGQRTYEEVAEELKTQAANQLQSEARLKEVRRIVDTFKPDRKAIEAFSATQKR